jgi:hypothetical protein
MVMHERMPHKHVCGRIFCFDDGDDDDDDRLSVSPEGINCFSLSSL